MESARTKQCRKLKHLFTFLHLICLFGPLLYFIPYGYITGEVVERIGLSFAVIASILLTAISFMISVTARAGLQRCVFWVLILGVMITLTKIQSFIWIMGIASLLDELIFVKIKDHYANALAANREIDRRA